MSTDSSTVKVVLTEDQKQKVINEAIRHDLFKDGYRHSNYIKKVDYKLLWFKRSTKEVFDMESLNKDLDNLIGLYRSTYGGSKYPCLYITSFGKSLIRLNKLIKSGNELSLSPDDSNALDYILNNEV